MSTHNTVKFDARHPQSILSNRKRIISLHLDHLSEKNSDGANLKSLYETQRFACRPEDVILFEVKNEVSPDEQKLYKFCKEMMKKKNFESILSKTSEILEEHPSSMWAHFFYSVACKKVRDKEKNFIPALVHAVTINPNFLSGWQALHKHFLSLGGFFAKESHDEMCIIVKVLLQLDPDFDNWCTLVGQIWHYVTSNDFEENRILSLVSPYLKCSDNKKREIAASVFVNFVRAKKKLLPKRFSPEVLSSFQILIMSRPSEIYRLGVLFAAIRYFNRTNDPKQICNLLKFIHVNDALQWNLKSSKEFAYNLIYEIFKTLGDDALEAITILRSACGESVLLNDHYFLCNTVFKLTSSYSSLLENYNNRLESLQCWARVMYLKVLAKLKLYQEAYEQILADLHCGVGSTRVEKAYMEIIIDILSLANDPSLQRFALKLGYNYLKTHGLNVQVLHCLALVNISLKHEQASRRILSVLISLGALDDVIYLQSLLEEDDEVKLDYLKSLENVAAAHLQSAVIYRRLDKPRRVLKSMLEASFHYHEGIAPFEWLGIYYYERDMAVKSMRYFLEAFSNFLVSCISVNYIAAIYSEHDVDKLRAFFETLDSRSAVTTDVACAANLKSGLNYLTKPKESSDFHRALEKFRKVTDFSFERKIIEMVADSLSLFGMHGTAAYFYLMCHAEKNTIHVYPAVLYGSETKMIKGKGHSYLTISRNIATKATKSPLALFTYACALFDRAMASYSVNNYRHCSFLCQQAILLLTRCIALCPNYASFWITVGNLSFAVSSMHADVSAIYVPSWLFGRDGCSQSMVLVKKQHAFVLALRCYSVALKIAESEEITRLAYFYIALTFRYSKTFYKEVDDRTLYWGLDYALDSCDCRNWQRNNLCGVILTGLNKYREALHFFKDAMLIGAREDARDAEFNLGIVHLRLGEFTDAHEVFMHRRGSNPMDWLVWRSYILLHQCLGDVDTVVHYLWYMIYSIKHNPSFDQGVEYLKLFCDAFSSADKEDSLKIRLLVNTILNSPMFMKMTFVGDCEVPHKYNDVTAQNYFLHGEFYASLKNPAVAEENFLEYLKLVAQNGSASSHVDQAFHHLAMSSTDPLQSLHDLQSISNSNSIDVVSKFLLTSQLYPEEAPSQLLKDLNSLANGDEIFALLTSNCQSFDASKLPPNAKKLYSSFLIRTLLRHLIGSSLQCAARLNCPRLSSTIIEELHALCGLKDTSHLIDKYTFAYLLENL